MNYVIYLSRFGKERGKATIDAYIDLRLSKGEGGLLYLRIMGVNIYKGMLAGSCCVGECLQRVMTWYDVYFDDGG